MAKYDYRCDECDDVFEITRKMTDESDVHCPTCSAIAVRSIRYAPKVKFIGEGFYVNDSKDVDGSIFDAGQDHDLI